MVEVLAGWLLCLAVIVATESNADQLRVDRPFYCSLVNVRYAIHKNALI